MGEPRVISRKPASLGVVPAAVATLAGGRDIELLWRNELGGLTYRVTDEPTDQVIKWTAAESGIDLDEEVRRLRWADRFTPVPHVVGWGSDGTGNWFVTEALPGNNAVDECWITDPERAVVAIGAGLRALHDTLPVADCPFSWSATERLAKITHRASAGLVDPAGWDPAHRHWGLTEALEYLSSPPPTDRLVVCHGDACAPNTLVDETGRWTAHVDFGALGVADRWADIAVATWSVEWNYGDGWERTFLDAYGVDPDPFRTAYYRLLWDLAD
jgi:kanamycin kinase